MNAHILKEEMLELVKIIRPKEIRKNHKLRTDFPQLNFKNHTFQKILAQVDIEFFDDYQ